MNHVIRITMTLCITVAVATISVLQQQLIVPIDLKPKACIIELKMERMGYPKHLASSFQLAATRSSISPEFLIALSKTESSFNSKAVSSKGYKGLMQIPGNVFDSDVNIMWGAKIFVEKMKLANNNLLKAICLYKGYEYGSARGMAKAKEVVTLFRKLKQMEV